MNFGMNFNDRKLFTGESKSTTRSTDINRFKNKFGARSVDEVRMARIKLKDQLNPNIYGPQAMKKTEKKDVFIAETSSKPTREERRLNHIEAVRNIRRGV